MSGACVTLSRVVLSILNLLLFLIGAGFIVAGVLIVFVPDTFLVQINDLQEIQEVRILFETSYLVTAAYVFMVLGAIIVVLSLCGCLGSCCLSEVLLGIYIFALIQIIIIQVGVGVIVILSPAWFENQLSSEIKDYVSDRAGSPRVEIAVNALEIIVGCCGLNGTGDYLNVPPAEFRDYYASCCIRKDGNVTSAVLKRLDSLNDATKLKDYESEIIKNVQMCYDQPAEPIPNEEFIYTMGCIEKLKSEYFIYGIIGIASVVVEILIVIFAFVVCCSARRDEKPV